MALLSLQQIHKTFEKGTVNENHVLRGLDLDIEQGDFISVIGGNGAGNQIEGRVVKGEKMVVVEDLISTGGSVLDAVAAAEREGADVIGVVAIFTYELPKAEKNFADAGVKLVTLSNYTELIKVAKVQGYITADGLQLLKKFKENQETWQD